MKKLNLKNQVSDDDEKLIGLLKTSTVQTPSEQFSKNTMEKFLMASSKEKIAYQALKLPLYLMLVIGLILLTPIFLTFNAQLSFPTLGFELESFVDNISYQLRTWYILYPLLLSLVLMSIVWIELGWVRLRNPFF